MAETWRAGRGGMEAITIMHGVTCRPSAKEQTCGHLASPFHSWPSRSAERRLAQGAPLGRAWV